MEKIHNQDSFALGELTQREPGLVMTRLTPSCQIIDLYSICIVFSKANTD